MRLLVEGLGSEAADIGLAKDALQAPAESRLRAARLYVNVTGRAFAMSVEYSKAVTDEFEVTGLATTWQSGSAGTHCAAASTSCHLFAST